MDDQNPFSGQQQGGTHDDGQSSQGDESAAPVDYGQQQPMSDDIMQPMADAMPSEVPTENGAQDLAASDMSASTATDGSSTGDDDNQAGDELVLSEDVTDDDGYQFGDIAGQLEINIKIPSHQLSFDESYFLQLLAGSISLTIDEKKKIIESIPRLTQHQVDELIKILEEEKRKFRELNKKHLAQLKQLEAKHAKDWEDLELQARETMQSDEDQAQADEIKKKLGL